MYAFHTIAYNTYTYVSRRNKRDLKSVKIIIQLGILRY